MVKRPVNSTVLMVTIPVSDRWRWLTRIPSAVLHDQIRPPTSRLLMKSVTFLLISSLPGCVITSPDIFHLMLLADDAMNVKARVL